MHVVYNHHDTPIVSSSKTPAQTARLFFDKGLIKEINRQEITFYNAQIYPYVVEKGIIKEYVIMPKITCFIEMPRMENLVLMEPMKGSIFTVNLGISVEDTLLVYSFDLLNREDLEELELVISYIEVQIKNHLVKIVDPVSKKKVTDSIIRRIKKQLYLTQKVYYANY